MGIWFDLILILVLVVSVVVGCKKGLFSVVKRFRLILSVFLAWQLKLTSPVRNLVGKICKIDRQRLYDKIEASTGEKLSANIHNAALSDSEKYDKTFGKLGGLLSDSKEYFMKRITAGTENIVSDITNSIVDGVYNLIFGIIGFIILLGFFYVIFTVIYHVLNGILNTGVLGAVNRLLGGLLGVVTGFVWMWILAIVFVKIGPVFLSVDASTIAGGLGIVKWFITKFFLSVIFGVTL